MKDFLESEIYSHLFQAIMCDQLKAADTLENKIKWVGQEIPKSW